MWISCVLLVRVATRCRVFATAELRLELDGAAIHVAIVVFHPGHRRVELVFVAALRHEIEQLIRADQVVETAPVRGVRVENVASVVAIEDADARRSSLGNSCIS